MNDLRFEHVTALEVLAAQEGRSARFSVRPVKPMVMAQEGTWQTLKRLGLVYEPALGYLQLTTEGWSELTERSLLIAPTEEVRGAA